LVSRWAIGDESLASRVSASSALGDVVTSPEHRRASTRAVALRYVEYHSSGIVLPLDGFRQPHTRLPEEIVAVAVLIPQLLEFVLMFELEEAAVAVAA
jgi:hypothetical protein